jgi:hypothetical protein
VTRDWRLPENRRELLQRHYSFSLKYKSFPGMVYSMLPALAEAYDLDADQRAWLVWLNGNTQNAVTSMLLLDAAPTPDKWHKAVDFWNDNFKALEWDTDRRHQKGKFGEATEKWAEGLRLGPAEEWALVSRGGWENTWNYSKSQPYMGRLSAWSMMEYARILLPGVPDIGSWMLQDKSGSQSHRNGLAWVKGYDSVYWDPGVADMLGIVGELDAFAEELLDEANLRNLDRMKEPYQWHPNVCRLTMESILCTTKSFNKPNRRYPNVYADMFYNRIRKAESKFGPRFELLWETRRKDLPEALRLEDNPGDPGLAPVKQNLFRETGQVPMMWIDYPDMDYR